MALVGEDFLVGDDLDAVLALLEEDVLEESEEFVGEVENIVGELNECTPHAGFHCDLCEKVCKSNRGLTRHRKMKHDQQNAKDYGVLTSPIVDKSPEALLHPLYFNKYINLSAIKLSQDQCYSEKTRKEFDGYEVSLDDSNETYQYIRDVLGEFKGNAEKVYPKFYRCVSEEVVFKNLSPRSSVLLGCEVANHVLAHLTGSKVKDSLVEFPTPSYSIKEIAIIKYLSGYVFGTIYRRIRRSKSTQSMLGIQSLSILLSGKSSLQNSSGSDLLIQAKDRGGLWNVTAKVLAIFVQVETTFRQSTTHLGHKIDSKMMVSQLMENPSVLCNFNTVRNQSVEKVSKEIALNLLEHLITLYVRVRAFSLAKDRRELHNITSKRKKKRSLCTEIKKASNSLDQGH